MSARVVKGQIVLRVIRDDMPFFIDEKTARKKIYHAPDFGVALPDSFDLDYIKSLSPRDRLEYLSDPDILPLECVVEYMRKLGQHMLDQNTAIKGGTLGENGVTKGWNTDPISGKHPFNRETGNDLFFADNNGFSFHTGINLNAGQREDLDNNNNIL